MLLPSFVATATLLGLANAQGVGTEQEESHPQMTWSECTGTGGASCTEVQGEVVIDANWRWVHASNDTTNCYTGNEWDAELCPDNETCSENCVVDGADYEATYGITVSGGELSLVYVTEGAESRNIGSRVYMMESPSSYQMFELLGNEFTFTVDLSALVCGLNGALYFVKMPAEGQGEAGAEYGTGYCDSQCPRDLKFIDGAANVEGWEPSEDDENAGVGGRGACCAEMDIWEANSISTAVTPHSCDTVGFSECEAETCGGTYSEDRYAGTCDPDGCDFNAYRVGVTDFYGEGMTVDTSQPLTVVTQFLTGNDSTLSEIKRFYVQGDTVIEQPDAAIEGLTGNSITTEFCDAENEVFQEEQYPFQDHGGMASMSEAMEGGMVLVMSLWGDFYAHMEWLDSNYPPDADPSQPGVARGSCENGVGDPLQIAEEHPDASVTFSDIRFGPIGSTFDQGALSRRVKA